MPQSRKLAEWQLGGFLPRPQLPWRTEGSDVKDVEMKGSGGEEARSKDQENEQGKRHAASRCEDTAAKRRKAMDVDERKITEAGCIPTGFTLLESGGAGACGYCSVVLDIKVDEAMKKQIMVEAAR